MRPFKNHHKRNRSRGVQDTLANLGMKSLKNIRQGKFFEIEIEEKNQLKAEELINDMCKKLLVNLIIEDYKISKL